MVVASPPSLVHIYTLTLITALSQAAIVSYSNSPKNMAVRYVDPHLCTLASWICVFFYSILLIHSHHLRASGQVLSILKREDKPQNQDEN